MERLNGNAFGDGVAAEALRANAHDLGGTVGEGDANVLKVRLEGAAGDTGDLGTNALQVLRATASRNMITNDLTFAANFTNTRHDNS